MAHNASLAWRPWRKEPQKNVRKYLLPAEHRVERVGDVVVSVFDYFFAQCYFYVRVTLWGWNRGQVMSLWGAHLSQFLGQTQMWLVMRRGSLRPGLGSAPSWRHAASVLLEERRWPEAVTKQFSEVTSVKWEGWSSGSKAPSLQALR